MKNHFDIWDCYSSDTFYERLKQNKYDIIIMDIALSGEKDGLQLTEELRKMDEYKNTPIIAMSAHVFEKDKVNAFNAGVDHFLAKPVSNEVLKNTLLKFAADSKS
jgi:two-component system sensor histidine kinase BarA